MSGIPFTLQLCITNDCNLRCQYCYEANKAHKYMPPDIAKDTISKFMLKDDDSQVIIDLAGGEPLLAFELIKELVDFAAQEDYKWSREYQFFTTTNGTLLTDEMKKWFYDHREKVILGLSLDGTKFAHDHNRSNSYDLVVNNIPYFLETWPYQPPKMTINSGVVDQIYEGILNIYSLGFPNCFANVIFEDVWGTPGEKGNTLTTFENQLELLVQYFSEHPKLMPPSIIDAPIELFVAERDRHRPWCGSGRTMVAVDFDGREYPCHRFTPTSINKLMPITTVTELPKISSKCDDCPFFLACQTCDAFNWETNNSRNLKTTFHCEFVKLQVLATAKLKYNLLPYRLARLSDIEDQSLLLAEIRATIDSILYVERHSNLNLPDETIKSIETLIPVVNS